MYLIWGIDINHQRYLKEYITKCYTFTVYNFRQEYSQCMVMESYVPVSHGAFLRYIFITLIF